MVDWGRIQWWRLGGLCVYRGMDGWIQWWSVGGLCLCIWRDGGWIGDPVV